MSARGEPTLASRESDSSTRRGYEPLLDGWLSEVVLSQCVAADNHGITSRAS